MEGFSDRIKSLCKTNGYTVKTLGDVSGVGFRTIESWLGAKQVIPKADTAVAVAKALKTTVEYLVTGIDSRYDGLGENQEMFQRYIDESSEEQLANLWELLESIETYYEQKEATQR